MACIEGMVVRAGPVIEGPWVTECYRHFGANITIVDGNDVAIDYNDTETHYDHWYQCHPGIDVRYMEILTGRLGLKLRYIEYESMQGLIDGVMKGECDITVNPVSLHSFLRQHSSNITTTQPITFLRIGMLAPEGIAFDMYKKFWLLTPFPSNIWWAFLGTLMVLAILSILVKPKFWTVSLWNLLRAAINQHSPVSYWKFTSERFIIISFEAIKCFLLACYGAMLIQHLVIKEKISPATNLYQVLSSVSHGALTLLVKHGMPYWGTMLSTGEYGLLRRTAGDGLIELPDKNTTTYPEIAKMVSNSDKLVYLGSLDSLRAAGIDYSNVRLVEGPSVSHRVYFLVYRRNFTCGDDFNYVICKTYAQDLYENLIDVYGTWLHHKPYVDPNHQIFNELTRPKALNITIPGSRRIVKMNLGQMLCVFYLFIIGMGFGIGMLLMEMCIDIYGGYVLSRRVLDEDEDMHMISDDKFIRYINGRIKRVYGITLAEAIAVANFNDIRVSRNLSPISIVYGQSCGLPPIGHSDVKDFFRKNRLYPGDRRKPTRKSRM